VIKTSKFIQELSIIAKKIDSFWILTVYFRQNKK